jgi:CheY-like chemotaxis protein
MRPGVTRAHNVEFPQPVLDRLAGKRFALVDFDATELQKIVTMLEEIGAFSRPINGAQFQANGSLLHSFDICICELCGLPLDDDSSLPSDRVDKPCLLVGRLEEILRQNLKHQRSARDFLVKPWHPNDLLLRSFHLLQVSVATQAGDVSAVDPTVIIADDDATTTTLIAALLRKHQVKSVIARDGGEAIQAIYQSHAQAMVLDVNMPKLDGFEVLQAIRQGAAVAPIKVAMLTSRQQETDIVRAFGLGADDYVVKPFNPLELVSRIKRLLRN